MVLLTVHAIKGIIQPRWNCQPRGKEGLGFLRREVAILRSNGLHHIQPQRGSGVTDFAEREKEAKEFRALREFVIFADDVAGRSDGSWGSGGRLLENGTCNRRLLLRA